MNDLIFYCAGSSKALYYAAAFLMEEGAVFLPNPDHTVTHLLLPIPSFEQDGSIKGGGDLQNVLSQLPRSVTVVGGNLNRPELTDYEVLDLLEDPWYLAKNASITAHCALELALAKLPVTLEKRPVLVVGWGRIGKCMAKLLHALGACVTVAARKESRRVMMVLRPAPYLSKEYLRASLIMPSLASPPPLAKNTQLMPVRLQRVSASFAEGSV